jgi:hypothetical protein
MTTEQENFENNLMPKLLADYNDTKEKGETHYYFDEERVRKYRSEGGFWIRAWEDEELDKNLSYLVDKGFIKKVEDEKYYLTDDGKLWKEKGHSE